MGFVVTFPQYSLNKIVSVLHGLDVATINSKRPANGFTFNYN